MLISTSKFFKGNQIARASRGSEDFDFHHKIDLISTEVLKSFHDSPPSLAVHLQSIFEKKSMMHSQMPARDKRELFPIPSILRQALFASNLKPKREYATRHKLLKPISELLGHFIVSKNKFFRCLRKLEFLSGQAVT